MSELSQVLARLKGGRSATKIVTKSGMARETLRRIERGQSVKISTLRLYVNHLGGNKKDWDDVVVAWVKLQLGKEAPRFVIQPKNGNPKPAGPIDEGIELLRGLSNDQLVNVVKALRRPPVIKAIAALNNLHEAVHT